MKGVVKKHKIDKNKSNIINSKSISIFLVLSFFFILGTLWERFGNRLGNFTNEIFNVVSSRLYSFTHSQDKIIIDIGYKNYDELIKLRQNIIDNSIRLIDSGKDWVPAIINYNDEKYKVKIKLKGTMSDHWVHPTKWSFRIKILDNKSINGIKEFAIQHPKTRDYLNEWIFMKILEKEDLISHRLDFYEIILNGDSLGIYNFQEQFSKQLLENNHRKEGPIIGFDKNLWIDEANNYFGKDLSVNDLSESFWRSQIKGINLNRLEIGSEEQLYFEKAVTLLESFRRGNSKADQVFNTEDLSKLMAIKALLGAMDFDWRDIKFYYNPITSLLEPIGREVHAKTNSNNFWWVDDVDEENEFFNDQKFLDLLYEDKDFYEIYLKKLDYISKKDYIKNIINENSDEFDKYKNILSKNFPSALIFSEQNIELNRKRIRDALNPVQGIRVHFLDYKNSKLYLKIGNLQRLPVEINALYLDNSKIIKPKERIIVSGKKTRKAVKFRTVIFDCEFIDSCSDLVIKKQLISYNVLGQREEKKEIISFWNNYDKDLLDQQLNKQLSNISKKDFLVVNKEDKTISFKEGNLNISEKIIFPSDYKILIKEGTRINFKKNAHIISYSPIYFKGKKENPIVIQADFNQQGNSISVINAGSISKIKNVIFKNLSAPLTKNAKGITGAINFYQSDVEIDYVKFFNNAYGDDYLNIIRSNFSIKNSEFSNIVMDAFDSDFSKGVIENSYFNNINNDALDFSESEVDGKNLKIIEVRDKGISVGERSIIRLENVLIANTQSAFVSKDLSNLVCTKCFVKESNTTAAAYVKKGEYGPAKIEFYDLVVDNDFENIFVENKSLISIDGKNMPISKIDFSRFKN